MGKLSDHELIELFFRGNQIAFEILIGRYRPLLHKIVFRFLKNEQSVEEALQDIFLKVFTKLKSFEGRSSFKSWICRVASNTALNLIRSKRETVDYVDEHHLVECDYENKLIENEFRQKIHSCMSKLPERQKICMEMRILEEKSFQEISELLNCPYDTAKANYRHGMLKIKSELVG